MAIETLTKQNFDTDVLQAAEPVLVEFTAPWCVYCRRLAPVLERIDGNDGIPKIGTVNIDEEPELARQYNIEVIPTLLIFQNGAHGDRLVAPDSQAKLEAWIHEQC